MRRMYEFQCTEGHIFEAFEHEEVRTIPCKVCDSKEAHRIVSAGQIKLDGCSGDFPGAYDRWERVRAEKLKQERKQNS